MNKKYFEIVYMEDESTALLPVARFMTILGHTVYPCDGIPAVEKQLLRTRPDIFIFDLAVKSRKNGYQFAEELIEGELRFSINQFIFVTAYADRFPKPVCFSEDQILHKSVGSEEILDKVNELMARHYSE